MLHDRFAVLLQREESLRAVQFCEAVIHICASKDWGNAPGRIWSCKCAGCRTRSRPGRRVCTWPRARPACRRTPAAPRRWRIVSLATCPHDHENHRWHSWKNATTTHMISGIIVRLTRRPAGPGRNAWCRRSGRRSPRARYPGALRKPRALRCRGRCSRAASRRLPRCCTSRAGRTAHIRSLSPGTAQTLSQVACTAPALPSKNLMRD